MPDKYSTTRYNKAPQVNHKRTQFDLCHSILTTFNTGEFVPILVEFINPGETVALNYASLTRLETSLHQTMDNAYVEFAFFFCPDWIIYDDFKKFEGENDSPWAQSNVYQIPQIRLTAQSTSVAIAPGSTLNHLALPAGTYGSGTSNPSFSIEALSTRALLQVYNDWYRDENLDSVVAFSKGSVDLNASNGYLFNGASIALNTSCLKVNRLRDRYSTALLAPQKGQEVSLSLGQYAPLVATTSVSPFGGEPLFSDSTGLSAGNYNLIYSKDSSADGHVWADGSGSSTGSPSYLSGTNLKADLSQATAVTINQLRLAIVRQAMLERDARGGTRYNEILQSRWNVTANSLEIGRTEFLGGKRIPVSMMEVLQTSETGTTVLGSDAGHSKTVDASEGFVKSFTQHGVLLGFMYVRTARSYSQGISRKHFMKDYLDMPDPMLDNIGEVPVYKKELQALAGVTAGEKVFGYQEQYYWLKEEVNRFSGYFQPGITGTLDSWHYGDDYGTNEVFLSADWLKETPNQVDRTIAVSSNASFQWSANVHFDLYITRPFSKYSIPNTFGF